MLVKSSPSLTPILFFRHSASRVPGGEHRALADARGDAGGGRRSLDNDNKTSVCQTWLYQSQVRSIVCIYKSGIKYIEIGIICVYIYIGLGHLYNHLLELK